MKVKFVTRQMIRDIRPMDMAVFELPSLSACVSARQQVYNVKYLNGAKYKTHVDTELKRISILRIA